MSGVRVQRHYQILLLPKAVKYDHIRNQNTYTGFFLMSFTKLINTSKLLALLLAFLHIKHFTYILFWCYGAMMLCKTKHSLKGQKQVFVSLTSQHILVVHKQQ